MVMHSIDFSGSRFPCCVRDTEAKLRKRIRSFEGSAPLHDSIMNALQRRTEASMIIAGRNNGVIPPKKITAERRLQRKDL
eukprot:CCRYP_016382-RB/>CCRYP_016382-RB protein AED:0.48 eAED:1.00 QI:0/0/0/1/0/0/2/0/79